MMIVHLEISEADVLAIRRCQKTGIRACSAWAEDCLQRFVDAVDEQAAAMQEQGLREDAVGRALDRFRREPRWVDEV